MNLSKRSEYALRALIDLGIARELGRPILQVSELASKEQLPIKFLEQILTQLRAGGYVETKRGKHGGCIGPLIVGTGNAAPCATAGESSFRRSFFLR